MENIVGLVPGMGSVSANLQNGGSRISGLGGEMTMFQVEFVTNENIIYPYSQMICVHF